MGSQRNYSGNGVFTEHLYTTVPGSEAKISGLKCKVIHMETDPNGSHSNLPYYSGSSDVYVCLGVDGKPKQIRVYENHRAVADFDWGHSHYNNPRYGGDGRRFEKGIVHVQTYTEDGQRNGMNARGMSNEELKKYGDIIKHYAPQAKLR